MKKPINEQFLKMQKIAGVITESQYISKLNEMSDLGAQYNNLTDEEKEDILVPYTDDGDVENYISLPLGELPADMQDAVKDYLTTSYQTKSPNSYTDDIFDLSSEIDPYGDLDGDFEDDGVYESKKTKMTKTKLKEAIRKEIMAALTEDGEMLENEVDLEEAKKDEDEEEEITLDAEDTETEDTTDDSADNSIGSGGSTDEVQKDLTAALNSAKELGDKKLVRQIGNALTYFTRQQISTEEV